MTKPYETFVKTVLGDHGYAAVQKAVAQMPELGNAVPSQTILSWVETCARFEYEGNIPGTENTFAIAKSEDGFRVRLNDESANFSSISGIAMVLASTLDFLPETAPSLGRDQLDQLVKSIDLLTKFNLAKAQGQVRAARPPSAPTSPAKQTEPIQAGVKNPPMAKVKTQIPATTVGAKPTQPYTGAAIQPSVSKPPTADSTKMKTVGSNIVKPPAAGKPQQTAKKPKRVATLARSETAKVCPSCGQHAFSQTEFVGCKCFADLAKSTYSKKVEDGFVIFFNYQWDADSINLLLKNYRG